MSWRHRVSGRRQASAGLKGITLGTLLSGAILVVAFSGGAQELLEQSITEPAIIEQAPPDGLPPDIPLPPAGARREIEPSPLLSEQEVELGLRQRLEAMQERHRGWEARRQLPEEARDYTIPEMPPHLLQLVPPRPDEPGGEIAELEARQRLGEEVQ
jgi:hypothetical protein